MTEIPSGAVTIADLFRELSGLRSDIQSAITSLKVIEERDSMTARELNDHESRMRVLERFRYTLLGASVTVSAVVSALGTWIGFLATHH